MENWLLGFNQIFHWYNFLLIIIGVFVGLSFASLPGLNNVTALILMLPFIYEMDPIPALIFMAAVYGGGIHGGCILAILFRIPGEPQSVCTCFDGAPMADQGKSAEALGLAFTYSSIGGLFGIIVCIIFAPLVANVAESFGPEEYFAFVFFGLLVASCVGNQNIVKGLAGACVGVLLSTIGVSPTTGVLRYTFDINILKMGINYISIIMGVFAIAELIDIVCQGRSSAKGEFVANKWTVTLPSLSFIKKTWRTTLRSCLTGTLIGFLPGAGATAASFMSYGLEVKSSKEPERYGKGEPRGVIASETANNASYGGAMIPMLTMAIPGSAATAVILGVLMLKNIQPSPTVFHKMPEMVYAVFIAMLIVNLVMFFESIFFGRLYLNMLKLPWGIVNLLIVTFSTVGTFSLRGSIEDVWIMAIFGIVGYGMQKLDFPVASLVLGAILGELAENSFVQAVDSNGTLNPIIFFSRPISALLMSVGIFVVILPYLKKMWTSRNKRRQTNTEMNQT